MRILVSDGIEASGAEILKKAGHEVVEKKLTPAELLADIANYEAIIVRSATKVTREVIDAGKKLKCIARGGVGLDNIDVAYAKEKKIPVLNTPGASSISVAELAIAHMMCLGRFIHASNFEMRQGKWPKKEYAEGVEVTGKTLGIVGFGAIGVEVAKRAIGLGMNVIAYSKIYAPSELPVKHVSLDELLAQADYITLHVPLDKVNGALITAREFDKMKKGVILVNCARGGVVSEKDLLAALNSGKVAFAGVDVFEQEPPTDAQKALIQHPKVSVTPHTGASTVEAQNRVGIEIANKVCAALKA
ncbi:MAG: D-2-hydroxyacid dehydrogenase [Oligoflexia bacterium]|nr:D-2-hydroxyacid dehydrogenase [Oligoflexia bacterium]